jgi:hypothetical protein
MPSKEAGMFGGFLNSIELPKDSKSEESINFFIDTSKSIFDKCGEFNLNPGEYISGNYKKNEILLVCYEDNLYYLRAKEEGEIAFDFSAVISPTKAVKNETNRDWGERSCDLGTIYAYLTSLSRVENKRINSVKDLVEK